MAYSEEWMTLNDTQELINITKYLLVLVKIKSYVFSVITFLSAIHFLVILVMGFGLDSGGS